MRVLKNGFAIWEFERNNEEKISCLISALVALTLIYALGLN